MGQTVKLRRSAISGKIPINSQLQLGELSMNTTDGKIFLSKSGSNGPSVEEVIITNTQNFGSIDIVGSISGSFFSGSGRDLFDIPASGVTGLSLDRIASSTSTASIDADGLHINTDTNVTGSLTATEFTGSGKGLTDVPIRISGSNHTNTNYDGLFTKIHFDKSTGIKVEGDSSTGIAKIYLDGVASDGGGGEGSTKFLEITSASSIWTFNHGLGEKYPSVMVFDSNDNVIIPQNIEAVSTTQLVVSFASPQIGYVTATVGGGLPTTTATDNKTLVTLSGVPTWKEGILSGSVPFNTFSSSIDTIVGSLDGRLDSLETESGSVRTTLNTYTSSNNGRVDSIESKTGSFLIDSDLTTLEGQVSSLETESGSVRTTLNTYTSSNDTTNTNQGLRLDSLETKTGSLDSTDTEHKGRLDSIENFTSSVDGQVRSDFNTYTSSNDGRVDSIESQTGSYLIDSDLSTLEGQVSSLETESGSVRSALNTYTSSNDIKVGDLVDFKDDIETAIELTGSNVTIKGNLLVKGTETRVNSTTVEVSDNVISLNGSGAANGGIEVRDATSPGILSGSLIWDGTENKWKGGIKGSEDSLVLEGDLNTFTSSNDGRLDSLETSTASLNSFTSSINTTIRTKLDAEGVISGSIQIDHDSTTNFVSNEHIDHSTITIGSGKGLEGGGTIDTNRSLSLNTGSLHFLDGIKDKLNTEGVVSGSIQIDITGTTNYNLVDGRLDSLETTSGSHDGRLDSLESNSGSYQDGYDYSQIGHLPLSGGTITGDVRFLDDDQLRLGTGNDLRLWHNGTNSYVFNYGGSMFIGTRTNDTTFLGHDGNNGDTTYFKIDGSNQGLYYYKSQFFADGVKSHYGANNDLEIYHDGSNSYITEKGTGVLNISSNQLNLNTSNGENGIQINENADVKIRHNNVVKLSTTSTGILVSGTIVATGYNDSNWNTAYGWGDHSTEGYVTSSGNTVIGTDTDLNFSGANVLSTIALTDGVITSYTNRVLTLANLGYTGASDANKYVLPFTDNSSNWNTAYGWGDHASVGYITGYSEVDTLDSVTDRGATTNNDLQVGGLLISDTFPYLDFVDTNSFADTSDRFRVRAGGNNGMIQWFDHSTNTTSTLMTFKPDGTIVMGSGITLTSDGGIDMGTNTITDTKVGQWNTAYGWGDHSQEGYLTSYNDEYTTGATFNGGNGIVTFTRNDGDTYTVDLSATLSEITITGGTYNDSNQTLTLTKSDGNTVDVTGFAIESDVNYYLTGATFNTTNGVITYKVKGSSDVTVDIDGRYLTSYSETDTLDSVTDRGSTTSNSISIGGNVQMQTGNSVGKFAVMSTGVHGSYDFYNNGTSYFNDTVVIDGNLTLSGNVDILMDDNSGAAVEFKQGTDLYMRFITTNGSEHIEVNKNIELQGLTATSGQFSSTVSAPGGNSTNWNTAYGWGDHSLAGYVTSSGNTIIGTDSDINTSGSYVVDQLTMTDGVITSHSTRQLSELKIPDTRAAEKTPNGYTDQHLSLDFTDEFGSLGSWYSGITLKGWTGTYAAWQLISEADSGIGDTNLYFRQGNNTTWQSMRTVWTSANFADNSSNWNTAYGWGDHSQAGYITGYSETDTLDSVTDRGATTSNNITVGYIGVGGTNPSWPLDVKGADTDNSTIARFYSNTGSRGSFIIRNGSGVSPTTFIGTAGGSEQLSIGTNNTEAIRLDASQNTRFVGGVIIEGGSDRITAEGSSMFLGGGNGNTTLIQFSGKAIPDSDKSHDLGQTNRYWKNAYIDVITATGGNSTNWNTSYGWGNHSGLYLPINNPTLTGVLTLPQHLKATGSNLSFSAGGNQILNIDLNGKIYPQTDNTVDLGFSTTGLRFRAGNFSGVVTASGGNSTNWNTAYGWGDHSTEGYITGYSEVDTLDSVTSRGSSTTNDISVGDLFATHQSGDNATTKAEMLSYAVAKFRPHSTNSGTLAIAQVDGGNSVGLQFTNGAGSANWDMSLQPFGGNVGINKINPSGALHVYSGTSERFLVSGDVHVQGATDLNINGTSRRLSFTNGNGTIRTTNATELYLQTNSTTALTIDANQNVSIVGTLSASNYNNTNWDTAYGWGDHASAGYLTSYSETDPIYTSERNSLRLNKMVQSTLLFNVLEDYNKPSGYSTMIQPTSYQNPLPSHGYYHVLGRRDGAGGYGALLQSYNGNELFHGNTTQNTNNITWYKIWTDSNFTQSEINNWGTAYGWGDHSLAGYTGDQDLSGYATETYVGTQIDNLIASAPGTLDTLNELAAALGDDPNFATTITNSIGTKLPLAGGVMSGNIGRSAHNKGYLVGGYNNIGASATATNPIFTIGTSYLPAVTTLGNMYGIGYTRADASFMGVASGSGWGMYVAADGDARIWLDGSTGDIAASGTLSASGYNDSNWNTAHGWGNHASGGYAADNSVVKLTGNQTISGTKTFGSNSLVISGTHNTISFMDTTSSEDNFYIHVNSSNFYVLADRDGTNQIDAGYESPHPLQLEGDTNTAYVFGDQLQISNWNTAYGWGDHASAGYTGDQDLSGYLLNTTDTFAGNLEVNGMVFKDDSNVDRNFKMQTNDSGSDVGLSMYTGAGNHAIQLYGVSTQYGFLDGNWAGWDIRKTKNGLFEVDEGSGLKQVWNSGTLTNNQGNWNTAYGWGDHASAGYLTSSSTQSKYLRTDVSDVIEGGSVVSFKTSAGHERGFIQATDTDDSHFIIATSGGEDIAFKDGGVSGGVNMVIRGDGNVIVTGSVTATGGNSGNWNTAYGWGNHASAGYITSPNGGNATTLDGVDSTQFLRSDTADSFTGTITMGTQKALVANNYGRGVYGLYSSTKYQHVWSMGTAYNLSDDGSTSGNLYGLSFTHTNVGGQSKSGLDHQLLVMRNGVTVSAIGAGMWTNGTITTTSHGTSEKWNDAYTYSQVGHLTSSSTLNASNMTTGTLPDVFSNSTRYNIGFIDGSSSQTRDKIRVWNNSTYTIGMKSGYSYGSLGIGVDGYAMSFQMSSDTGRGFWWGSSSHSDAQGAMSLTVDGKLTVAKSLSIGQGETITTPSTTPLYVEGTTAGETVFEVQGTSGQLFSITDSLVGDIFEVSDISGVPIFTVNSSGVVTVDDTLHVKGDVIAYYASDRRLKDNIKPIENSIDKIKMIGGYEFDWNSKSKNNHGHDVGVIAQEIEEVLPELVGTRSDGFKGVKYEKLTALLIQANKELIERVEELESKLKK